MCKKRQKMLFSSCEREVRKCGRSRPQRRNSTCWVGSCAPQGQPTPADHQDLFSPYLWQTQLLIISRSDPTGPNLPIQKTHLYYSNQTFPFPCSVSRREMAEDQPRLYVQMAEDQPHLYTQMAEDQPHLYVQMPELGTNGIPSERQSPPELAARAGSVLTFHNICYRVRTKTGHLCFQKTAKKEVLRDVKYVSKFQHLFRICVSFISVWRAKLMPLSHSAQHADEDLEKLFVFAVSCAKAQVSVPRLSLYTRELNSLGPGDTALLAAIGTGHTSQLCWFYTPWQSSHCARVFSWDTSNLAVGKVSFWGRFNFKC